VRDLHSPGGWGAAEIEWFELRRDAPPTEHDCIAALFGQLREMASQRIVSGSRVGVAVGSRGIARIDEVVRAVVTVLRERGAEPVLIPAMGSHGGATPAGQVEVLHELGVDERQLEIAIDASMEVEQIGTLGGGQPVYLSKTALGCDAVVPVNRVKPHTDFRAPVESGLTKMLTIGLGKEKGAASLHAAGFGAFANILPEALDLVLGRLSVPFGAAVLEDKWHRLHLAEVVAAELVLKRDELLLAQAWDHFARLPFEDLDVLVLREMGKTISGAGMDPNVTGRFPGHPLPAKIHVERLAVLDLTDGSLGNAIGVGVADVVTERLRSKIDWGATYANAKASRSLAGARLPIVVNNDLEALALAVSSLTGRPSGTPGIVAMGSTLDVNHIAVSEPLVPQALRSGYSVLGPGGPAEFDQAGNLLRIGDLGFFSN
jgi:hypothetical protein